MTETENNALEDVGVAEEGRGGGVEAGQTKKARAGWWLEAAEEVRTGKMGVGKVERIFL